MCREIPEGVQVLYGRDTSINIRASIKEVVETIFIAFLLVIAIIFAFLRQARTTLIPMVVVPVAVIGSFFVLYLCGFSINVLTLLAMVLAIGLVVDDAIVVVEAVHAKLDQGYKSPLIFCFQGFFQSCLSSRLPARILC